MSRLSFGSRIKQSEGTEDREEFFLIFDGVEFESGYNSTSANHILVHNLGDKYMFHADRKVLQGPLLDLSITELAPHMGNVQIDSDGETVVEFVDIGGEFQIYRTDDNLVMAVAMDFDQANWNKPWSTSALTQAIYEDTFVYSVQDSNDDPPRPRVYIEFSIEDEDGNLSTSTVIQEMERTLKMTRDMVRAAEEHLRAKLSENSIVSHFHFPSGIRSACEEYLLSFVQFLKDVGVEATADLKHEPGDAGGVLFSVTPERGKEALGKIRQALDLYLKLAETKNFETDSNASIQVDRLESRILFFQSQIRLAQAEAKAQLAEIQQQGKAIEAQEATIAAQRVMMGEITAANVFLRSRVDDLEKDADQKDELEFFGGLVKFSNPEAFGFTVNLAMLFAMLKPLMFEQDTPQETDDTPVLPPESEE